MNREFDNDWCGVHPDALHHVSHNVNYGCADIHVVPYVILFIFFFIMLIY